MPRPLMPIVALALTAGPAAAETLSVEEVLRTGEAVAETPAPDALSERPRAGILERSERAGPAHDAVERFETPGAEPGGAPPETPAVERRPGGIENILEEVPGGPESPVGLPGDAAGSGDLAPVPLPATIIALLAGLAGLVLAAARRRVG